MISEFPFIPKTHEARLRALLTFIKGRAGMGFPNGVKESGLQMAEW